MKRGRIRIRPYVLIALALAAWALPGPRFHLTSEMRVAVSVADLRASAQEPAIATSSATGLDAFTTIGFRLPAGAGTDGMTLRTHDRTSGWSAWRTVGEEDGGPDRRTSDAATETPGEVTEPIWVGDADGYELQAPADLGGSVDVLLVREEQRRVQVDTGDVEAGAVEGGPDIQLRSAWGARAPKSTPSYTDDLKMAVVHHSVSANTYTQAQVPAMIRSIQAYHMDGNGWSDIGYNFIVDRFGGVWEGRAGGITTLPIGAHVGGFNTGSTGVVMLGDFSNTNPSAAQVDATGRLIGWKLGFHRVDPASTVDYVSNGSDSIPAGQVVTLPRVIGHRNVDATACPGNGGVSQLDAIRTLATNAAQHAIPTGSPMGSVDYYSTASGSITVHGWAFDPDTTAPVGVFAYVDSASGAVVADLVRTDHATLFPGYGPNHGYTLTIAGLAPGQHFMCVYAFNTGPGSNRQLFCNNVVIPDGSPRGGLDYYSTAPGSVTAYGWAYDPDTTAPIGVYMYVDNASTAVAANLTRTDVGSTYPASFGPLHGYQITLDGLAPGPHTMCTFAYNVGEGSNKALWCGAIVVPDSSPIGGLDYYSVGSGTVTAHGWAYDPDTTAPIGVYMYVDNSSTAVSADLTRTDYRSLYPSRFGANHGYRISLGGVPAGSHSLCVFAYNTGGGSNRALWCGQIST